MGSKDSEQSAESAVQLTSPVPHDEYSSDLDTYRIKTLRSGKVVKVPNCAKNVTALKERTMEDLLGIDESLVSSHTRKFRNGWSQRKTRSLTALTSNLSHSKSQSSDGIELVAHAIEDVNSQDLSDASRDKLGQENERSNPGNSVVDGSSMKNVQHTSLLGEDDMDIEGMTLRQIQRMLKSKRKSSSANSQSKSDDFTTVDSNCHIDINSDQRDNFCSSRSAKKRKCEFEEGNVTTGEQIQYPKEEGFPDPKQGQTLGNHKQKVHKMVSSQNSQRSVQSRNEIFSVERQKQKDFIDLTKLQNSNQDIISSENAVSSNSECELGLDNISTVVADCQQNAVEMMELDSSPNTRYRIENESTKQNLQKVPILVDVEPSTDTLNHTGYPLPINTEAVDCNSEPKNCELSLLSDESYCVQKHRSLSPVAKVKLFPSGGEVIQDIQVDSLSILDKPESSAIDNVKRMPESVHSASATASNVIDANPASTTPVKLPVPERLDIEQDNCGDAFQQQPAKLPSARKSMSPISRKRLMQAVDFRSAFTKSRPPESSPQQSELDAMDARVESLDTYLKSLQSPDGKATGSPCNNRSSNLQRNSPFSLPKSPRYSPRPRFQYSPSLADRLDIPSSPLLRKTMDSNDVGVQREISLSPSIKGILKSPGISCPTACKCDICFSVQVRSDKASEFSQRQMRDIEALAQNLLKDLKTMRIIAEENVNLESTPLSKFTVEEINQATANALEAEERTKRWINMMSRDCNRFCKIMKRPSDKRTSLSSDPQKQQKKIIFADEAGKELCHVKIFEKDEKKETFFEKHNNKDEDTDGLSDGSAEGNL